MKESMRGWMKVSIHLSMVFTEAFNNGEYYRKGSARAYDRISVQ
jgi:hypothetical protein